MNCYLMTPLSNYGNPRVDKLSSSLQSAGITVFDPRVLFSGSRDWLSHYLNYLRKSEFGIVSLPTDKIVGRGVYVEMYELTLSQCKFVFLEHKGNFYHLLKAEILEKGEDWRRYARLYLGQRIAGLDAVLEEVNFEKAA